jgi:hypothetical protein
MKTEEMVEQANGQRRGVSEAEESARSAFENAAEAGRSAEAGRLEDIFLWEHGVRVEPWPEPVDGKELLDALEAVLNRFVVLGQWVSETLALWIVHTYAFHLRDITTYIGVESPEPRCGKTTLLSVLCELVNRPVVASNISSPAFFRVIAEKRPTLMIDEADTLLHGNDQLRGILNSGYAKKTAYVVRVVNPKRAPETPNAKNQTPGKTSNFKHQTSGKHQTTNFKRELAGSVETANGARLARFSCWCPKVIATIKHLPATLADRCILIAMQRKAPREKCERLRQLGGTELRRKCARFALDHAAEIASARPVAPEDLNDRAADIWEPLLAVSDLAGGNWPERARNAATGLTARAQGESPMAALLLDLMVMFVQDCAAAQASGNGKAALWSGRLFSRDIVAALNCCVDRPWVTLRRGKAVTEIWLAQQLRPFGIRPKTIWIGEEAARGYLEEDFKDAFQRYIPRSMMMALVEERRRET